MSEVIESESQATISYTVNLIVVAMGFPTVYKSRKPIGSRTGKKLISCGRMYNKISCRVKEVPTLVLPV